jgi:hypothetical protein
MWEWGVGEITINTVSFLQGEGSEYLNYFFTLTSVGGMMAWGFGLLCKLISRS